MKKWGQACVGDLVGIVSGGTPARSNSEYYGGGIPWVTPKDMKSWHIVSSITSLSSKGIDESAARLVPANSVLVVVRSGILKHTVPVGINQIPVAINQDIRALICSDRVHSDFLAHFIKSQAPRMLRWVRATTADNFPVDSLKKLEVPLPGMSEQRRIAAVLDQTDALRAKRREALAQLDELAQSIFLDMFGDPYTNPRGWRVDVCGSVCDRITVGIVVQPASYYQDTGVAALRSLNVRPHQVSTENLVYFSKEDNETRLRKTRIWKDDVVLVRSGQPGAAAIVPSELDGANAIDILIATPTSSVANSQYLCSYFNSHAGRRMLLGEERGQVQKHLNVGSLKKARVPVPPLQLQEEFARRVEAVERLKALHRAHLAELDELFTSLQQRAFRGEL